MRFSSVLSTLAVLAVNPLGSLASPLLESRQNGISQGTFDDLVRYTKYSSAVYQWICPNPVGNTLINKVLPALCKLCSQLADSTFPGSSTQMELKGSLYVTMDEGRSSWHSVDPWNPSTLSLVSPVHPVALVFGADALYLSIQTSRSS